MTLLSLCVVQHNKYLPYHHRTTIVVRAPQVGILFVPLSSANSFQIAHIGGNKKRLHQHYDVRWIESFSVKCHAYT